MSPLEQCPFFEKAQYIKKEHYSNFWTFEIASFPNVPGYYLRKYGTQLVISSVHCQHTQHLQMSCLSLRRMDGPGLTECAIIAIAGETRPNYGIEKTCQIWKTRLEYGLQQLEKRKQRTHFGLLLWQSGACNRPQEKVPRIWIQIPQRGLLNHIMPAARRTMGQSGKFCKETSPYCQCYLSGIKQF